MPKLLSGAIRTYNTIPRLLAITDAGRDERRKRKHKGKGLCFPRAVKTTWYFTSDQLRNHLQALVPAHDYATWLTTGPFNHNIDSPWVEAPLALPVPIRDLQGRALTRPVGCSSWYDSVLLEGIAGIRGLEQAPADSMSAEARCWFRAAQRLLATDEPVEALRDAAASLDVALCDHWEDLAEPWSRLCEYVGMGLYVSQVPTVAFDAERWEEILSDSQLHSSEILRRWWFRV